MTVAELPKRFTALQVGFQDTGRHRPAMEGADALLLEAVWIARAGRTMFDPRRWTDPNLRSAIPATVTPLPLQVLVVACLEHARGFNVERSARLLGVHRTGVTTACATLEDLDLMEIRRHGHRTLEYHATPTGRQFALTNLPHLRSAAVLGPDDGERFWSAAGRSQAVQNSRRPSTIDQAREAVEGLNRDLATRQR
jgi:hypothetical protein